MVLRLEFYVFAYAKELLNHNQASATSIAVSYDSMLIPPSSLDITLDDITPHIILKEKVVLGYDKIWL
jgi:hypothetical protein